MKGCPVMMTRLDSNSIVNQKKYLESYAHQKGYTNCQHYTDDGWSGGNFERPAWKQLIEMCIRDRQPTDRSMKATLS